jgi:hypothetical protein
MSTINARQMQSFNGIQQHPADAHYNDALLLQQLKWQIEFYFCPQNLANDQFLQSQLMATDHLGAVPIEVICNFPKVRQLHALARFGPLVPAEIVPPPDPQILRVALNDSSVVRVSDDGMWITPVLEPAESFEKETKDTAATVATSTTSVASTPSSPSSQATASSSLGVPTHPFPLKERNTIIVRDIPENVSVEVVMEAFSTDGVTPKSARPDVGDTWYVAFESEDQAVTALSETRDRTIAGVAIRGRLKTELAVNSKERAVPPQPPALPLPPAQDMQPTLPNLHSKPPQAQYRSASIASRPFHPAMQMPPQQPHAYGYVPYPYAVSMQPQHMQQQQQAAYRMQQQYFQPYGYQQYFSPRQQQGYVPSSEGYSVPPPHVYVQPKQNQNNKKRNKRGGKNRNHNNKQNNNGGDHVVEPNLPDTNKTANPQKNNTGNNTNRGVSPHEGTGPNGNKKQWNRNRKKNDKKIEQKPIELSAENFPALGGNPKPKTPQSNEVVGYAQALLKRPTQKTPPPPKPASPANAAELESAMNKLAFSEVVTAVSYDEW